METNLNDGNEPVFCSKVQGRPSTVIGEQRCVLLHMYTPIHGGCWLEWMGLAFRQTPPTSTHRPNEQLECACALTFGSPVLRALAESILCVCVLGGGMRY